MVLKNGSIEIENLSVQYSEFTRQGVFSTGKTTDHLTLSDISISIHPSERVAVIGRNGSGKSTLLSSMAGMLRPREGSINTRGRALLLAGVDPGFSTYLTGSENVSQLAPAYGIPRKSVGPFSEKVKQFTELGDDYERKYGNYSSGMKGKLGFGFISHLECDILLIDEVFGAGDRDFKAKAKEKMEELIDRAATVVMCTHSLTLAREICDRCIVLEGGGVAFDGPIEDGLAFYRSLKKSLVDWIDLPYAVKTSSNGELDFNFSRELGVEENIRLVIIDNISREFFLIEEIPAGSTFKVTKEDLPDHLDCKFKLQQNRFGRWYDASNYIPISFD